MSREECIQNAYSHMKSSSKHWHNKLAYMWDACENAEVREEEYEDSFPTERKHKYIKAIGDRQAPTTPLARPSSHKRERSPGPAVDDQTMWDSSDDKKVLIDRRILDDMVVHIGNARKIMKKGAEIAESANKAFEQQRKELDRIMSIVSGAL